MALPDLFPLKPVSVFCKLGCAGRCLEKAICESIPRSFLYGREDTDFIIKSQIRVENSQGWELEEFPWVLLNFPQWPRRALSPHCIHQSCNLWTINILLCRTGKLLISFLSLQKSSVWEKSSRLAQLFYKFHFLCCLISHSSTVTWSSH